MSTLLRSVFGVAALALLASPMGSACWAQVEADEALADGIAPSEPQVWPSRFYVGDDAFTVYPLQLERWERNRLEGRAAVAVQAAGADRPLFGVVSVAARTDLDQASDIVTVRDIEAGSGSFPTAPKHAAAYIDAVRRHLATVTWQVSRERLEEGLVIDQAGERTRSQPLRNDPPRIVYVASPTILVPIDGEPVLRDMEGLGLRRVLNTRALILQDPSTGRYFLHIAGYWLEAAALSGPWTEAQVRPATLDDAKRQAEATGTVDLLADDESLRVRAPDVIVSTGPTELVQTDGPPQYAPIARTDLLFVTNSPNRLLLDLRTQLHYVLLAGRWYRTPSLVRGSWDYVPGAELPADFAMIPDAHPTASVRVAVPGTPEAREAAIANDVPEFATVKRSAARLEITYDGAPQFRAIDGTRLEAALNAPVPVIRVDWHTYYALDNGVWFFSDSAYGPWTAATSVPSVVYTIPRSDPLHYVTYVRVYDATPDVVYIGYTPGYVGSYTTIGGTVVYGSGWYYRPWIGTVWYATPVTWGFGFSFSYSWWDPWPHRIWWAGWRPVPCFRPAWGPWPHRHVGVTYSHRSHYGTAVIPAKAWPTYGHGRNAVGSRTHDRGAFHANGHGVHDIYRRWDPRNASDRPSDWSPDSRSAARHPRGRDATPSSFARREDPRQRLDRSKRHEERQSAGVDAPRWVRPAERSNPQGRTAAPGSPRLRDPVRPQPGAGPAAGTPRSPALRADRPDAARSHPHQFDRSARPGDHQGVQPQVPRRDFRADGARPALQDPRWSTSPRSHPQQRGQSPRPDTRREFREAPTPRNDWRRDRASPSAAATAPGSGTMSRPRARNESFTRDAGRRAPRDAGWGSRNGPGNGAHRGGSGAR